MGVLTYLRCVLFLLGAGVGSGKALQGAFNEFDSDGQRAMGPAPAPCCTPAQQQLGGTIGTRMGPGPGPYVPNAGLRDPGLSSIGPNAGPFVGSENMMNPMNPGLSSISPNAGPFVGSENMMNPMNPGLPSIGPNPVYPEQPLGAPQFGNFPSGEVMRPPAPFVQDPSLLAGISPLRPNDCPCGPCGLNVLPLMLLGMLQVPCMCPSSNTPCNYNWPSLYGGLSGLLSPGGPLLSPSSDLLVGPPMQNPPWEPSLGGAGVSPIQGYPTGPSGSFGGVRTGPREGFPIPPWEQDNILPSGPQVLSPPGSGPAGVIRPGNRPPPLGGMEPPLSRPVGGGHPVMVPRDTGNLPIPSVTSVGPSSTRTSVSISRSNAVAGSNIDGANAAQGSSTAIADSKAQAKGSSSSATSPTTAIASSSSKGVASSGSSSVAAAHSTSSATATPRNTVDREVAED